MGTAETALTQLNAHYDHGDSIPATITGLHAYARYSNGWNALDFVYELPSLICEVNTDLGPIHLDITIRDITAGNLHQLLDAFADAPTDPWNIDIREFVGETIHLAPSDRFRHATPWPTRDSTNQYDQHRDGVLYTPDESVVARANPAAFRTEPRTLDWLNRQLRVDYERAGAPYPGWLERRLGRVDTLAETLAVTVPIMDGWQARWAFENSFRGHVSLQEFAVTAGLPTTPDELAGTTVYLRPVRDLDGAYPLEKLPYDALERWVLVTDPRAIDEAVTPSSRWHRLWDWLTARLSSGSVNVSIGDPIPAARSSDDYAIVDDSRPPAVGPARPPEQATDDSTL